MPVQRRVVLPQGGKKHPRNNGKARKRNHSRMDDKTNNGGPGKYDKKGGGTLEAVVAN